MRAVTVSAIVLSLLLGPAAARADEAYQGSTFREVWDQVRSDPYANPQNRVTVRSFYGFLRDYLLEAARRTLRDRRDLLPRFDKLLHPNGICLAGTWEITEPTPYTGYFRQGRRGLFIGRASTALSATRRGEYRAFGLAGKLFPTEDQDQAVPTANFFTIEDLGGTLTPHFLDAENTNDIIGITIRPSSVFLGPLATAVGKAFLIADRTADPGQTLIRQLYPIAEAGERGTTTRAPRWMKIVGADDVPRVDRADFRDELRIANYPDGLRFAIHVADEGTRLGDKAWREIGVIEIFEDAVSDSCDHRLHFAHPTFRR